MGRNINPLQPLLAKVFRIPERKVALNPEEILTLFVDATEQEINRPSRERIIVEHVIAKMKIFRILAVRFRNPRNGHTLIFKNIAGIHNMMFT